MVLQEGKALGYLIPADDKLNKKKKEEIRKILKEVRGIVKVPSDFDYEKEYRKVLEEKYLK